MAMLRRIYYVCIGSWYSYTFNIPFSEMNPEFLMAWVGQWDDSQYHWAPCVQVLLSKVAAAWTPFCKILWPS